MDPSFWGLVCGCGTSANYPIANLYTITGINSTVDLTVGLWVLTMATMGMVEAGAEAIVWVSTLTLYLLLAIMVLFLLSMIFALAPGAFLTMGVGAWLGRSWLGLGLGPGLWIKFPF